MKNVQVTSRDGWRSWLARNHDKETKGTWLVFHKTGSGRPSVGYEEAVEEALCFGWIDSIIKRIDDEEYVRKFSPRRPGSPWSGLNKARVAKTIAEGRMTRHGLAKIEAAKKSGSWDSADRPLPSFAMPSELARALTGNETARRFFDGLAPTYRKHFIGWIASAKRPETKERRIGEAIALLAQGRKLGLK
jgi:uncharacterized protein YdeI (YjbR/CyaY-like superfamily)